MIMEDTLGSDFINFLSRCSLLTGCTCSLYRCSVIAKVTLNCVGVGSANLLQTYINRSEIHTGSSL